MGKSLRFLVDVSVILVLFSAFSTLQESALKACPKGITIRLFIPLLENIVCIIFSTIICFFTKEATVSHPSSKSSSCDSIPTAIESNIPSRPSKKLTAMSKQMRLLNHLTTGFLFAFSQITSYHAFNFVTYPVQVMAKSSKLVFAMPFGLITGHRYRLMDWLISGVMCTGLTLLFLNPSSPHKSSSAESLSLFGLAFLAVAINSSALFDELQNKIAHTGTPRSRILLCEMSVSACVLSSWIVVSGAFLPIVAFLSSHPLFLLKCTAIAVLNVLGQYSFLDFKKKYGTWWKNAVANLRKCLTILLSLIIYGHKLALQQTIGVSVVFFAIGIAAANELRKPAGEKDS